MASGEVGRAAQQHSPSGFPQPHLHIMGTVSAPLWLTTTGATAGNTNTSARITAVPRHRPEPDVIDSSIGNK